VEKAMIDREKTFYGGCDCMERTKKKERWGYIINSI
jgi:hypothetical protein